MREVRGANPLHPDEAVGEMDAGECIGLDKGGHTFVTLEGEAIRARKKREENLFYDGVDSIAAYESHFATCTAADEYRRKK